MTGLCGLTGATVLSGYTDVRQPVSRIANVTNLVCDASDGIGQLVPLVLIVYQTEALTMTERRLRRHLSVEEKLHTVAQNLRRCRRRGGKG